MEPVETTMEPVMAAVSVPSSISGVAIVDDLLNRIADRLSRNNDLRAIDRYAGYSATVEITLQLHDVSTTETSAALAVGTLDPALPVQRITLGSEVAAAEVVEAPPPLEHSVDGTIMLVKEKRYYTPRGARPRGL